MSVEDKSSVVTMKPRGTPWRPRIYLRGHGAAGAAVGAALLAAVVIGGTATAARAHARPPGAPPSGARQSPPPAWIATSNISLWLAFGSYCWTTLCVDFFPPSRRTDLPRLQVKRGARLEVHFEFIPRRVVISGVGWSQPLQAKPNRTVSWPAMRSGIILVAAVGAHGEASYLVRLRILA